MANYKNALAYCAGVLLFFAGAGVGHTEFAMNWAADGDVFGIGSPHANCNRGEGLLNCGQLGGRTEVDKTPFLMERVRDADGQTYYHMIIGVPGSGDLTDVKFAQETYIRAGGSSWFTGIPGSSSIGANFRPVGSDRFGPQQPFNTDETISGNATANPTRVQMVQINNDGELQQEFVKDRFLFKPKITQTITSSDGSMTSEFVADLSDLLLSDMATPGPVINRLTFADGAGSFDMAVDAPNSVTNAGQYRWVPGTGPDGSFGTWEYVGGAFDPYEVDWITFRNDSDPDNAGSVIKNPTP